MPGGLHFLMFYTMFLHVTSQTLHFTSQKYDAPNWVFCCWPFSYDSSTNPAQLILSKMMIFDFSHFYTIFSWFLASSWLLLGSLAAPGGSLGVSGVSGGPPLNHCKYHQFRAGASILHHVLLCYALALLGDPSKPL